MKKLKAGKEFLFGDILERNHVSQGLRRKIKRYDDKAHVLFQKEAVGTVHEHFYNQATYMVSGKVELQVGDKKKVIREGDDFYIPHSDYSAICLEKGELIDVFSPIRADLFNKE